MSGKISAADFLAASIFSDSMRTKTSRSRSMEQQKMLANLKATIAARRLRQVDVAIELKMPPSVLSEVINGRRQANASVRARLAELLNANEGWLFSTFMRIPGHDGQPDQPSENAPHTESVSASAD